jgi:hypothetical protein
VTSASRENKAIAKKIVAVIGGNPSVARFWDDDNKNSVDLLSLADRPTKGVTTVLMYYPDYAMKHLYFTTPFLWEDSLSTMDMSSKKVSFLLLIKDQPSKLLRLRYWYKPHFWN